AIGINAQSLGGGGGNGGFAISGAIAVGAVSAAVGGHGGGGSNGGTVTVDNQGDITTSGDKAYGIFAQSVGGGGGNGGSAVAFTATASPDPAEIPTVAVSIAVGGGGGDGSIADTVHVTNGGDITTYGTDAHGIWAQSVGGGGGTGGYAASGSMAIGPGGTITVAVGGTGGTGETAGAVIVDAGKDDNGNIVADSLITTYGMGADGIRAQSIGGGGGDGGFAVGVNVGINNSELLNVNLGVTVGGSGGVAGNGSTATVNNWAGIRTYGDNAAGIFAQSAGGGGGDGGNAITGVAGWANATSATAQTVNMSVAVGGKGGAAGDGQDVTVNNHGTIETGLDTHTVDAEGNEIVIGNSAYGIFAQSIGGGGGIGGRANSINVLVGQGDAPPGAETNIAMSVAVGGNGGGAGNGGHVTVNNYGNIITNASMSDGIYAESVGGGGGAGGNGLLGTGELIPVPAALIANVLFGKTKIYSNLGIVVGGQGGSNGTGGLVEVTNTGSITTKGSNSNGIFAQSVGGGGGVGGKANIGATGTIGVGGKGTSGGDGGIVTVTNNGNGTIETFGAASNGIFAQSIGGGGGVAGNVDRVLESAMGPIPALNLGIGLAFGQGGGNGGSGKDVTVDGNGAIITHGTSSAGIFAQSVGGGGGILGTLGNELIPGIHYVTNWAVGSNGDAGDSGLVHVDYAGTIDTYGSGSIGIFAQSNGGKKDATQSYLGIAGNVTVDLTGSVVTHAAGTDAIVAQSKAVEGNGNIAINLNSSNGMVMGGATDSTHIGVGVWLVDGNNNTISNKGTITTASGTAGGWAILASGGNEAVTNYGAVTGSFDLGTGANSFTNVAGAIFNAGADAKLGAGNLFSDNGYFSPGGDNNVMTTNLVGNWTQSSTGAYKVDVDLDPASDLFNISGTAIVAGAVDLNIMDPAAAKPGSQDFLILHADEGVTNNGLKLNALSSAVAQYQLQYPNADDIVLNVDINFAPTGLTGNETVIGNLVNTIQSGSPPPSFNKIAAALYYVPTVNQLGGVYDAISGEGVSGVEQPQFDAYGTFLNSMTRQADFWRTGLGTDPTDLTVPAQAYAEPAKAGKDPFKALQPNQQRWSYWATAGGNGGEISGNAATGSAGNVYSGGSFAAGLESAGDPDVLMGFALGGSSASFAVDDRLTSGNIIGGQAGAYLTRKWDQFYINGALAFGLYNNNVDRDAAIPGSNAPLDPVAGAAEHWKSNFLSAGFSTNVEAGWRQTVGAGAITPFAGLQFGMLSTGAFNETSLNGGALGLSFGDRTVLSLPVSLGLQLDTTVGVGDGRSLQAWGRAAWVHEFEPDRSVKPEFQAAPGYPFVIQGAAAAENAVAVDAGLKMNWGKNTSVFAAFDGKFGQGEQAYGGNVGFKLDW
ncbi:MAG: autotransporter domain-containing protein, partial [Pseudomonadota bacterium]